MDKIQLIQLAANKAKCDPNFFKLGERREVCRHWADHYSNAEQKISYRAVYDRAARELGINKEYAEMGKWGQHIADTLNKQVPEEQEKIPNEEDVCCWHCVRRSGAECFCCNDCMQQQAEEKLKL